jgi:hypothetical protein
MSKWNRSSIFILALLVILSAGLPGIVSADWSTDPTANTPICTANDDQSRPQITSDGAGGAIIVWCDGRNGDSIINVLDMTKVARIILELDEPTPGADANQDGSINIFDMTKIAKIILQIDPNPCL